MGTVITAAIMAIVISIGLRGASDPKKKEARIQAREERREARKLKRLEKRKTYVIQSLKIAP